jgi:glycosyltransferase involved in cell wall biosynthesis
LPKFSVITAVYNGARTIEATLESIRLQTFKDFEYIVVDGASTDSTMEILRRWDQVITCWKSEPDFGVYEALNRGLALARGEWISFLGADDTYLPDALGQYAAAIATTSHSAAQYVSSRVELVQGDRVVRTIGSGWSWPAFAHHMTVAHVGSMHHRSLFEQYGNFDQSYRICGDYEFLLRPRDQLRSGFIDRVTARMSVDGMSTAKIPEALAEQARAKRTTGGRAPWRCTLEQQLAHIRARSRQLLWY